MELTERHSLSIRRASPADAREICEIHKASIRRLCASAYSADTIDAWTDFLSPERYPPAMSRFEFFVAEGEGILGFLILDLEGGELNALYLDPDAAGRGIGRRLVEHAERLARIENVPELKLKSTLNAVGFYEACGFSRVRESVHVNPAGVELPCVLMIKPLDLPPPSREETHELKP